MRHHALNDCSSRAFGAAGIPVRKEPAGLVQKDGKRPHGCTLIRWRGGRPLAWDVTVCHSGCFVRDSRQSINRSRCRCVCDRQTHTETDTRYTVYNGNKAFIDRRFRPSLATWEVTLSARKVVPCVRWPATGITAHSL